LGLQTAFALDALTFFASALLIARISYTPTPQGSTDQSAAAVLRDYRAGFRYLFDNRDILVIVVQKALVTLCFAAAYEVTAVPISQNVFIIGQGGGIGLGLIYATVGLGTGLGPIVMRLFTGDGERALRVGIMASFAIAAIGMFLAAPMVTTGYSFALFLLGLFIRGFGGGTVWVFASQLALQSVADKVRGRVFATEFALFSLTSAIAAASAGWALEQPNIGYIGIVWVLPVLTLLPALWWAFLLTKAQRKPPLPLQPESGG
jgi:MFS family permease